MGYYIQTPDRLGKAMALVKTYNATVLPAPPSWANVPSDKAVICVANNGHFEAAGLCYSEHELEQFAAHDGRRKDWLLMDKATAHNLSGFTDE